MRLANGIESSLSPLAHLMQRRDAAIGEALTCISPQRQDMHAAEVLEVDCCVEVYVWPGVHFTFLYSGEPGLVKSTIPSNKTNTRAPSSILSFKPTVQAGRSPAPLSAAVWPVHAAKLRES